jgi:transcriptional regulator with XRE-family HTH domain
MASSDLAANLRLLCSYGRSVSAICRQAGINRHQLQRYLNGTAHPSLHTLRKLSDFFGVEEHEILLPAKEFAAIVKIRPPLLAKPRDRMGEFMAGFIEKQDQQAAAHYEGYYHGFFQLNRRLEEVQVVLTRITMADRCLTTKSIEIHPHGLAGMPRVLKYEGIGFTSPTALTVIERRPHDWTSTFFTVLYGMNQSDPTYLAGLVMGVAPDSSRDIYALRTCWRYLGRKIDVRKALKFCGHYPLQSEAIDPYVRYCTRNDISPGEEYFAPYL